MIVKRDKDTGKHLVSGYNTEIIRGVKESDDVVLERALQAMKTLSMSFDSLDELLNYLRRWDFKYKVNAKII
jgi:DNA integrity scanning protein DisA with diadenylate cyclase activity